MNALARGKKSTEPSADALKRYLAYGRPNSMIFMHPTRSLTEKRSGIYLPRPNSLMNAIKGKRGQQVYLPRPNSLMNAIKGKRAFLHGSPNSFNFPIWTRSAMDVDESEDDDEEFESGEVADIANFYEGIEKYGKRDGNFDVFLGNRG